MRPAFLALLAVAIISPVHGAASSQTVRPSPRHLVVGGFHPYTFAEAPQKMAQLEAALPRLKQMGITSHQTYVLWNLCETAEGRFDWTIWDGYEALYRRHHIKWVPFLIAGPAYSVPAWYADHREKGSQGYVCLEHGEETNCQSLWSPALRPRVARFLQAFLRRYGKSDVLESVMLGITGIYGEAIYVADGAEWTAHHAHTGIWAGDPEAVAGFRSWVARKYSTQAALSKAWGRRAPVLAEVHPFVRLDAPSDRAWLDMMDWYIGSMNDWARFWLSETRKHYAGPLELCTGGYALPAQGADFGDQCKVAAAFGAGVRITNEGDDCANNFSITRWVASAGRQYGATFSFEPGWGVSPTGVVSRVYGATTSGANGLHFFEHNLLATKEGGDALVRWSRAFVPSNPMTEVALYYPETHIRLTKHDLFDYSQALRDRFDFGYVSDNMILDGGLRRVKALVLMQGPEAEPGVWRAIARWRAAGGLVLAPDGMGTLRTIEGDSSPHASVLGTRGRGRALVYHGDGRDPAYRQFLVDRLATAPELSATTRAMISADGREDHLFVSLVAPSTLMWFNQSDQSRRVGDLEVAPYSIASKEIAPHG